MRATVDGELLVVTSGAELPARCVRCDKKRDAAPRPHTFVQQTNATAGGAVGGAFGATLVALGKQNPTFYIVGGAVAVGGVALLVVLGQRAPKVEVDLPLCAPCEDELAGVRARWRSLGFALLCLLAVFVVTALLRAWIPAAVLLAGILGLAWWVARQRFPEKFLRAERVAEGFAWVRGASPSFLARVAKRAARAPREEVPAGPAFTPSE